MTTAVVPPESPASADVWRMLPIAANLLPPEIIAARRARQARRVVLFGLVVFVVLLAAWYGIAALQTAIVQHDLTTAEDQVRDLEKKQHEFDDLISMQQQSRAIDAQLAALLANDLQWSTLLTAVYGAAPPGVKLTNISGSLAEATATGEGTGATAAAAAGRLPNTTGQDLVGEITITGVGPHKRSVAEFSDALAKLDGLGNPLVTTVTVKADTAEFTVRVDITDARLGGRFTPQTTATPSTPAGK